MAFWVLGVLAVATGIGVFRVDSMARATFLLLASFLCVAGELLLLGSAYLAVLVVLMMTMEMVIMVVFMLMYMMNPAGLMPMTMVHNRRGAAAIAAAAFVALAAGIWLVRWPERRGAPPEDVTAALGFSIMGPKMLVMMTIGVALLATMIASVVLATHRGRYHHQGDDVEPAVPARPPSGAHAHHDHGHEGRH